VETGKGSEAEGSSGRGEGMNKAEAGFTEKSGGPGRGKKFNCRSVRKFWVLTLVGRFIHHSEWWGFNENNPGVLSIH